jgi:hypothetical protein
MVKKGNGSLYTVLREP